MKTKKNKIKQITVKIKKADLYCKKYIDNDKRQ